MSAKYNITATFSLEGGDVEPEGVRFEDNGAEDFEDNSYFSGQPVECDGGELRFVVTADDAYEAEERAREVIDDDHEVEDYSGRNWVVQNVAFAIEKITEPMTLDRARTILAGVAESAAPEDAEEIGEAVSFVLTTIAEQTAANNTQAETIRELRNEIDGLKASVARLTLMVKNALGHSDEQPTNVIASMVEDVNASHEVPGGPQQQG